MTKKLNILLILENAGAGSGRHVVDLCQGLVDRGHKVHLLYSPFRLEEWFEKSVVCIEGLSVSQVPLVRGISYKDLKALREVRKYIGRFGPFDIVHGHSSKGGAIARIVGSWTKSRRVYTPHAFYTLDGSLGSLKRHFYRLAERILGWLSDGVICLSQVEFEHARSIPILARKLFLVNNGIGILPSADRQTSRRRMGVQVDEICIGFVGRLAPQKSVDRLLHAFAKIARQAPNARMAIVGSGSLEDTLKALVKSLQLEDRVIWVGQGNGPALMAGFDFFATASHYEAFPYVFLEAGARGLPIVTTNVGGAQEIIVNNENGVVVEQDDVEQLSAAMLRLCQDATKRQQMSEKAKKSIEKFSLDRMVSETIAVYKSLSLIGPRN